MIPKLGYDGREYALLATYLVSAILCLLGNSVIVSVILKSKKISNTYMLIMNQCLCDALCGFIYITLWFTCSSWTVSLGSGRGAMVCDTITTIKVGTFFVSAYNMTVIAIDRYLKLYHPMSKGLKAKIYVPVVWVIGLTFAVVNSFHFEISLFFTPQRIVGCRKSFPLKMEFLEKRYNELIVYLVTIICLLIILITYWKVIKKIQQRKLVGQFSQEKTCQRDEAKMRTTYMLIATVIAYVVLCSPIYSVNFIDHFVVKLLPECTAATEEPFWYLIVYFCAVSSTAVNPIIFCYFNLEIRKQFTNVVRMLCGLQPRRDENVAQIRCKSFAFHSTTIGTSVTT
ncbi:Substance-K receptor [Halotydeus destructor]|nr:Substance-K receptor [Halotydeus destructor]